MFQRSLGGLSNGHGAAVETNSLVELAKPPFDWSMAALIGVGIAFVGAYAWLALSGSVFLS